MAGLNHKGPIEKGPKTGRILGNCKKTEAEQTHSRKYELGKGLGWHKKNPYSKGIKLRMRAGDYQE